MNVNITTAPAGGHISTTPSTSDKPTRVRYGVLAFCCVLSMITYLDRVCFGTVAPYIRAEFDLSRSQLGWLFTAFALAYAAFEVPTGYLGDLFGARKTLIRIVLWWSAFTALTGAIYPYAAWPMLSFLALLAVRFFFGVGEAGAYPNISRAFASWFPFGERGSAQGAVWMAGRFAGGLSPLAVLALVYTTTNAEGQVVTNWRHIFWIFGALGIVWCVLFWAWFRDRPEDHPAVNDAERALIRGGQAEVDHGHGNVPWGKLLTDANLWTLCIMYFGCAYGWYFNITWLPTYLEETYQVKEASHGFWTVSLMKGMPLLLGSLACLVGGLLTDWFIRRTGDRKWGRRIFGMIGHGICAVCYFLALTANSPYTFVLFVALAAFWNDITMGSAWASCIDIGGKYAGIVSGCMNTIGNLGGAVAGITTGYILDLYAADPATGWAINFISFGVVYVLAVFLWLRFDATKPVAQSA
jgi:MFS transporter, ACS family, glucarate transporter